MPRAKPADRLRKLEEQRAQINAEIQRVRGREVQICVRIRFGT